MMISLRSSVRPALGAVAFLLVGVVGLPAHAAPDAWITVKTKIALAAENQVDANGVHVDTTDGRITLYGKVNSEGQKKNAAAIATAIKGATGVRNLLQVVAPAREKAVNEADDRIKDRITGLLKADTSLADSNISVKAVNKGAVLLSGTATTLSAHLRAVESTSSVAGVRSVASEIKSPDELTEAETSHVANDKKDSVRDSWTTALVKLKLLADGDVPALEINVDTYHGIVTLFGIVPTLAAKNAALADARKVDSVVSVNDELQIVHAVNRPKVDAKDDIVERDVKMAILAKPELSRVNAVVKNGKVHLTGNVASGWDRLRAATLARGTKGVRSVDDDLHIDRPRG